MATGARPSANLLGPFQVDTQAVQRQVQACRQAGVGRGGAGELPVQWPALAQSQSIWLDPGV